MIIYVDIIPLFAVNIKLCRQTVSIQNFYNGLFIVLITSDMLACFPVSMHARSKVHLIMAELLAMGTNLGCTTVVQNPTYQAPCPNCKLPGSDCMAYRGQGILIRINVC